MGWFLVVLGRVLLGKTFFEEIRGGLGRGQLDTKSSSNWFEIALKSVPEGGPGEVPGESWGNLGHCTQASGVGAFLLFGNPRGGFLGTSKTQQK